MRTIFSVVNVVCKLIAWGLAIILGFLTAIIVITVMSIIWAISASAGLAFLGFVLLIVWMMFYIGNN